jgi:hypothetical protein
LRLLRLRLLGGTYVCNRAHIGRRVRHMQRASLRRHLRHRRGSRCVQLRRRRLYARQSRISRLGNMRHTRAPRAAYRIHARGLRRPLRRALRRVHGTKRAAGNGVSTRQPRQRPGV